jgi:hypothetical protein
MRSVVVFAIGITASPVPTLAILLLLTGRRPAANGAAFAAGWSAGIGLASGVFLQLVLRLGLATSGPFLIVILELFLGTALLVAAAHIWNLRRRNRYVGSASLLTRIQRLSPPSSVGLGLALVGANPKVLGLALGASLALAAAGADTRTRAESVVVLVTIGSAGVVVPLAAYLVLPPVRGFLAAFRAWLLEHESAVVFIVSLTIGAVFILDALRSLRS